MDTSKVKTPKSHKMSWSEKEADKIAESSAMTPKKYRDHLKEELAGEADHWGDWPSVPVWCGTFVIVEALERAYKRGYSAGKRASQHRVEPTAPAAKRNSRKSTGAVSSKRRGGSR